MTNSARLALACVLACGCFGGSAFRDLPEHERVRFSRCWDAGVYQTWQCDSAGDMTCRNSVAPQYAREPSAKARRQWLLENGCPASMVRPANH